MIVSYDDISHLVTLVCHVLQNKDRYSKTNVQKIVYFLSFDLSYYATINGPYSTLVQTISNAYDKYPDTYKNLAKDMYKFYVDVENFIDDVFSFTKSPRELVLLSKVVFVVNRYENDNLEVANNIIVKGIKVIDDYLVKLGWKDDFEELENKFILDDYISFYIHHIRG